jgi:hypothetical protein
MRNDAFRRRDGDVPDIDDGAIECLGAIELNSFAASPTSIRPFHGPATLDWSATVPVGCRVGFRLNGSPVARSGSLEVFPAVDTAYALIATAGGASRVLGRITIDVDTSACTSGELAEFLLRGQIEDSLESFASDDERVYDPSLDSFEIRSTGLSVSLHMKLEIDNFTDPRVDADFVIGLTVDDGVVHPYYRSFTTDVDWPWYITTLSLGITKIVEEFLDGPVQDELKPAILKKIQGTIDGLVALLPDDMKIHSIRLAEDAVVITACPEGDLVPSRVLAVPVGIRAAIR